MAIALIHLGKGVSVLALGVIHAVIPVSLMGACQFNAGHSLQECTSVRLSAEILLRTAISLMPLDSVRTQCTMQRCTPPSVIHMQGHSL
jgi:hypothetical protein